MLYTIGHAESYEKGLNDQKHLMKKGRDASYQGGIVFETREDAETYLERSGRGKVGYKAYGLITNMTNTAEYEFPDLHGVPARALLRDAQVVRLDP